MIIKKLKCENYRNIKNAEISLCPSTNVIYGNNAQGKTNLLEAIYYFACGKSFRGGKDKELIRFGQNYASAEMEFCDNVRERHHKIYIPCIGRRSCTKEGIRVNKMCDFIGYFRAVLFSPEHLSIVKDGPSERRSFEDIAISQIKPEYMSALSRYNKLLSERNSLLKAPESVGFNDMIYVLSERLAEEAEYISSVREIYTKKLSEKVGMIISDMTSGREKAEISYDCRMTREEYFKRLTSSVEREIRASGTLYGIHRDDIQIKLNGSDARSFGSQGQQRSLALAMKLAEGEISREESGEYPVFLFDDVLSELDKSRKDYVLSGLNGRQIVITCCEEIPVGAVYTVNNGCVEQPKG